MAGGGMHPPHPTPLDPPPWIDVDFFIFILLSRESDGGAMHRTNPLQTRLGVALVSEFSALILHLASSIRCLLDSTKQR